jgi:hypothetical protein
MRYEVLEESGEWIVTRDGAELGRFAQQHDALADVAERLRATPAEAARYSLTMRYQPRG